MSDLRLGRWEDALRDVEMVDAVITDPPFGARTHSAWREGGVYAKLKREPITYTAWTPDDVAAFVKSWSPRTRGWMVALTSHDLAPAWEAAYEAAGRCSFAPLPCVTRGGSIRLSGDGPSSWTVWAMVARPRTTEFYRWGTLPGAYLMRGGRGGSVAGRGKPLDLMRGLINDYSRRGDLVCDPCAGFGTTLLVAERMGRRAIGAEVDAVAYRQAIERLGAPVNADLFAGGDA